MWIVAKLKIKILNFSKNLKEKLNGVIFYFPKIKEKDLNKNLLGNYVFCIISYLVIPILNLV